MKARDIIPGWPRGRSTSQFIPEWRIIRDYGRDPIGYLMRYGDSYAAFEKAVGDVQEDIRYHEGQRRMIWRVFESTILNDELRSRDWQSRILAVWIDGERRPVRFGAVPRIL